MNLDFRVFDIPVRIRLWFVPMAFALGLVHPDIGVDAARMLVWILVLGAGLLSHELGHAFAAKAFGWEPRIELGFVAISLFKKRVEVSRGKRVLFIVLGPLVGLSSAAMAHSALVGAPLAENSLSFFTLDTIRSVNLAWGAVNLLPLLPLDGGQLVAEVGSWVFPRHGVRIGAWISIVVCVLLAALGAVSGQLFLVAIAIFLGYRNHRLIEAEKSRYDGPPGASARDLAYVALTRNDAASVVTHAKRAQLEAKSTADSDEAAYLLAWGFFLSRDAAQARAALLSTSEEREHDYALEGAIAQELGELEVALELYEKALPRATQFIEPRLVDAIVVTQRFEEASLLFDDDIGSRFSARGLATVQRAAYDAGKDRASMDIGETLFQRTRDASVAFLLACSSCRLGELDMGLVWLHRARERGFDRREILDGDPALAPLRERPEWDELRESFGS